ncbi:hypothetical protein BY996DRAFT_8396979 [Phakopsora pachyrhizi]|nr:hypothetical protein BY996DRAFT_8396979 [Phakopsora pachyrhizi]
MGPMYYVLNLKWLQLSNVLILGSIVHINRGSLELIESSSLNSVTRNFKMNDPSPRLNNIVIPGFGDAALEIPSKELKTQESTISFLRIPKFDLNELPQDMDSGMIHSDDVENSKVESERYYKLALKWRQMEPDHQSLSPTNSQSPIVNLGSEHKFVTSNKAQTINEPEISRDVRNWQPEINFNQKEGKKHSPKIFEENLSGPSKRDSTEYETSNNRKRKKSDLIEDRISSSESKRENKGQNLGPTFAQKFPEEDEKKRKGEDDIMQPITNSDIINNDIPNLNPKSHQKASKYFQPPRTYAEHNEENLIMINAAHHFADSIPI